MTTPVFQVYKDIPVGYIQEDLEVDLNLSIADINRKIGFLIGYAGGVLSFLPGEVMPIRIANYEQLDEYERMRCREILVLLSTDVTTMPVADCLSIKLKAHLVLEPDEEDDDQSPRVLITQID